LLAIDDLFLFWSAGGFELVGALLYAVEMGSGVLVDW
jgi:hypothetical protein